MRVLVACEFSGIVRDAFRARGHRAISCDLLASERPGPHVMGDVLPLLKQPWDLVIAHPPCTYLTNAGVRHLYAGVTSVNGRRAKVYGPVRWVAMEEAAAFFRAFVGCAPRVAIENPVPHAYARRRMGNYTQLIQPWMFGHGETKATCLWLEHLPNLVPTRMVAGREHRMHDMPSSVHQARNRSRTFVGIAAAMAEQWGNLSI